MLSESQLSVLRSSIHPSSTIIQIEEDSNGIICSFFAATAAIAAAISAGASWQQIRKLPASLQSSTYQSLINQFDNFTKEAIDHPNLISHLLHDKKEGTEPLTAEDRLKLDWLGFLYLNWAEAVSIQSGQLRLIPEDLWEHWKTTIRQDLHKGYLAKLWQENKNLYHTSLMRMVEGAPETK